MNSFPLDILVVLQDLDLKSFLRYLVPDSFSLQVLQDWSDGFLKTGWYIQNIDFPSDLLNHG